ncbi:MAG TPA: hypothetical protein VK679_13855 [Gemmatimonadaceae bacterium]|nr:hypothetical protein [Gemmatimonadaceae bacterium]
MNPAEAFAGMVFFASIAMVVIGAGHYVTKLVRLKNERIKAPADVEMRLARLEVAIDDMAAELTRVTEGQQFVTKLLAEKSAEAAHGRS